MNSDTTRVINFNFSNQNPANAAISAQANTIQATNSAANIGTSAAVSGAGATGTTGAAATGAAGAAGSFFATKAGIIIISVVATVAVATAVVVPVVVTQTGDDDPEVTDALTSVIEIKDIPTTILNNENDHTVYTTNMATPGEEESSTNKPTTKTTEAEGDTPGPDPETPGPVDPDPVTPEPTVKEKEQYYSDMLSLTQNNFLESKILSYITRNPPSEFGYEEVNQRISYGGDNSALDSIYDDIIAENNKLIPSSNTYDEIGSDGKLYLNKVDTGRKLYKHVFSDGLYGSNISNDEKAVKKIIKLNPVSSTNYITGLYAPPGEIITIEISDEDLKNIGGSLTFLIGFYTHNNIFSINSVNVGIRRVPNLSNSLTINKPIGYIGSFIGGPIYISNPSKIKQFTVTITGAVPYKHIIFGSTTKKEYESMSSYTAPFFEFDIRDSIRYSGGASIIKNYNYENLILNLLFWDKCLRTSRQVPSGSNINLGIHFLFDPCVNSKGALALAYVGRNWCQVPPSFGMALDFETATKYGVWGHIHELNHHFQRYGFNSVSNEVTNNVINIVEYILYTQLSGLRNAYSNAALTKISGNHNYMNPEYSLNNLVNNPPNAADEIRFYEPIIQAFGPHLFLDVTRYGGGRAGVDLFYESLVMVMHQDFTYYIEKVLNLVISESKKIEMQAYNYPIFIPITTIYQTGRYYSFNGKECFSNTSYPYRIPKGGATKLDFVNHLIYPKGFTVTIVSLSQPAHGTLKKLSDLVYTYEPDNTNKLSGRMELLLNLANSAENLNERVKLGLEFEVDNSQSVQTNYIFDSVIYTDLNEAKTRNYAGYSNTEFFPNFAGAMTGIKEGNVGVWEGKFRIDDEGYKYILYRGGRGPSELYARINNEAEYKRIGYITINQGGYMFAYPSFAYYEINLNKGDIVYFKAYLLGYTLASGASASLYIGISKEAVVSKVRTLGSNDIVGIDSEFDVKYEFVSGDPYYSEKKFDSLSFFDYSLVSISSPNYESWDGGSTFSLDKLIDRNANTYIHTKKNKAINANNPLTLIFDLGRKYYYDYIYFVKRSPNNYAPKVLTISTSDDNVTYTTAETITANITDSLVEMNLSNKLYSRYVKMHITETTQPNPGYIALVSVEFIEKNVNYALKNPEYVHIFYYKGEADNVQINYDNFPYFGHSYILKAETFMNFEIQKTTGIRIKTCHKNDAIIDYIVKQGETQVKSDSITIDKNDESDFPVIVTGLDKGDYKFEFIVKSGNFDLEYILYEF